MCEGERVIVPLFLLSFNMIGLINIVHSSQKPPIQNLYQRLLFMIGKELFALTNSTLNSSYH